MASGAKQPFSASRLKLGIRPSAMYFWATPGSKPSSPTTIIRLTLGLYRLRWVKTRTTAFRGHIRMIPKASAKVPSRTRTLPAAAKPAPGPM